MRNAHLLNQSLERALEGPLIYSEGKKVPYIAEFSTNRMRKLSFSGIQDLKEKR